MSAPDVYVATSGSTTIHGWPTGSAAVSLGFHLTVGAIFAATCAIIIGKLVDLVWSLL